MNSKYFVAAIFAYIIWGFFSLPLRALSHFPAFDILSYRIIIALVVMLFVTLFLRSKILKRNYKEFVSFSKKEKTNILIVNALSGLIFASNWFLFIYVMNNVSVNATSLAYLICPIMTVVFAFLILKEKVSKLQWVAVLLCVISCLMMSVGHLTELFYSIIIALSYAFYPILQKKNQALDRFIILTVQVFFAVLFLLPFFPNYVSTTEKTFFFYEVVVLITIVFTILPMYLTIYALKHLNSSVMGILMYINPILTFLLAILYFNEKLSLIQGISYTLILFSVILFNSKVIKERSSKIKMNQKKVTNHILKR